MVQIYVVACGLTVVLQTLFWLYKEIISARAVPGPFLARLTRGWYAWKVWQGSFHQVNIDLHKKYGNIICYSPGRYSIDDPDAVKLIYGLGKPFAKSSWYTTWSSPGQWALFGDSSIPRHAHSRKQYQATYSMTALVNYESFVDDCATLFSRRLTEVAEGGEMIDMRHWLQCYAFDVIGMITYGERFGFLDHGQDVGGIISALDNHLGYATMTGIFPGFHWILYPLKNFLAGKRGAGRAYLLNFTKDKISAAQHGTKKPATQDQTSAKDFLTKFLEKNRADPDNFTPFYVLSGCVSNMVAGSDTTAISLSAILYYLLQNPACLEKLCREIDEVTQNSKLSRSPTYQETQQMPYLQAVLKEAMRLHPATGLPLERVVPVGGATICDRHLRAGSVVGINTWVAHRNKQVFGDDAEVFSPERWLIDDAASLSKLNQYWMPFGLGSRTCLGRHISMLEMSKLIPLLLRDFSFELDAPLDEEGWDTQNYWFVKPLNFRLRIKIREGSA